MGDRCFSDGCGFSSSVLTERVSFSAPARGGSDSETMKWIGKSLANHTKILSSNQPQTYTVDSKDYVKDTSGNSKFCP